MPSATRVDALSLRQGLKYELIQQTALTVLTLRVAEGIAAWLLYNELFFPAQPDAWAVHAAFVLYFGANALLCWNYRNGRITGSHVIADVLLNVGIMAMVSGATGGVAGY